MKPMPSYRCFKVVTALRIAAVQNLPPCAGDPQGQTVELTLEDGSQVQVVGEQYDGATPGCYFVRDAEGQTSVQSATLFERWHTPTLTGAAQLHESSSMPSKAVHDDSMDQQQYQSLASMEAERRQRRDEFDRMERLQAVRENRSK